MIAIREMEADVLLVFRGRDRLIRHGHLAIIGPAVPVAEIQIDLAIVSKSLARLIVHR